MNLVDERTLRDTFGRVGTSVGLVILFAGKDKASEAHWNTYGPGGRNLITMAEKIGDSTSRWRLGRGYRNWYLLLPVKTASLAILKKHRSSLAWVSSIPSRPTSSRTKRKSLRLCDN